MLHAYHPEMNEKCDPTITTHASLSHYGKHYFLRSTIEPNTLIKGRGVEYLGQSKESDLVPGSKFVGYHNYKVTVNVFEKLQNTLEIGYEMLLD